VIFWTAAVFAATPADLAAALPAALAQLDDCARAGCDPHAGAKAAWIAALQTYEAEGLADGTLAATVRALDPALFDALPDVLRSAATEPLAWAVRTAVSTDPLETVPELSGVHLRSVIEVRPTAEATCETAPPTVAEVARGDVPTLTFAGRARWRLVDSAQTGEGEGRADLPFDLEVGDHRVCVETSAGAATIELQVTEGLNTQVDLVELQGDGSERFRNLEVVPVPASSHGAISQRWMTSDSEHLTGTFDGAGNPVSVVSTHDAKGSFDVYDATLDARVPPGAWFVLERLGTRDPMRIREVTPEEFRLEQRSETVTQAPIRDVELYRLPAGAELLDAGGFQARTRDGAIELVRSMTLPLQGVVTTQFTYRLVGGHVGLPGPHVVRTVPARGDLDVDPALAMLSATYDADMRPSGSAWLAADAASDPKIGRPRFVDSRTCEVPVHLQPDHDYVVWLNYPPKRTGFFDTEGRAAAPYELRFHTRAR
jgi:hypothetical protein